MNSVRRMEAPCVSSSMTSRTCSAAARKYLALATFFPAKMRWYCWTMSFRAAAFTSWRLLPLPRYWAPARACSRTAGAPTCAGSDRAPGACRRPTGCRARSGHPPCVPRTPRQHFSDPQAAARAQPCFDPTAATVSSFSEGRPPPHTGLTLGTERTALPRLAKVRSSSTRVRDQRALGWPCRSADQHEPPKDRRTGLNSEASVTPGGIRHLWPCGKPRGCVGRTGPLVSLKRAPVAGSNGLGAVYELERIALHLLDQTPGGSSPALSPRAANFPATGPAARGSSASPFR